MDLKTMVKKKKMERMMGFEPTTSTLARLRSTPELHPLDWKLTYGVRDELYSFCWVMQEFFMKKWY